MAEPYLALSLARLRSQVKQLWPSRSTAADGWIGDAAHQAGVSDHNPDPKTGVVRALDITTTKAQAKRILAATINDPRVQYVIYDRKIWILGREWAYTGTNPHSGHVHVSIKHTTTAEDTTTNWEGLGMAYAVSPMEGRFTSGFDPNRYIIYNGVRTFSPHGGIDIAPKIAGTVGTPVYAMFAGTVTRVISNRKPGQTVASGTLLHPGISGNGPRVDNPDGEFQIYCHVKPVVKVGQKVKAGDLVGHTDTSGFQTGPHLHFGTYDKNGVAYDPMIVFDKYGIKPGERPKTGDWLSMVDEAEVRKIFREELKLALHNKRVPVTGTVATFEGRSNASFARLANLGAAAYTQGLNAQERQRARDETLSEAVKALANSVGADGDEILEIVESAVSGFLEGYKLEGSLGISEIS